MLMRRLLVPVVFAPAFFVPPGEALAAVPAALLCTETKRVDCFQDEIFVVDGAATYQLEETGGTIIQKPLAENCFEERLTDKPRPVCEGLAEREVYNRVTQILREAGVRATWDTMAIFGAGFPRERRPDGSGGGVGPWFFRVNRINEVDGIGIPRGARGSEPFVGYIAAGSTTNFGVFITPEVPPPTGLAKWPDPDPAGVPGYAFSYPECNADAVCYRDFHNGYQALASAVAQMFGPQVEGLDDRILRRLEQAGPLAPGQTIPRRTGLFDLSSFKSTPTGGEPGYVWNSLLNFETSLMGGNRWRLNGDGTAQTTLPSPFWAASPPYQGESLSRFHPIELYLMGLLPAAELDPIPDYSFKNEDGKDTVNPLTARLDELFGFSFAGAITRFGQLSDVAVQLRDTDDGTETGTRITDSDRLFDPVRSILGQEGGRDPDFSVAPHTHRQMWVVVTKPNAPSESAQQLAYMQRWRRAWNAYYYMLTSYRGRMVTTADASFDDSPYWEFGQPLDDARTFVPTGGLQVQFPGPLATPGEPAINSFARVLQTPGATGALQFSPHENQLPLRIKGKLDTPGAINALAVRLRLPTDGPPRAEALLQLPGGVAIRLPSEPSSFLIPDGRWHTYSADLSKVPGYAGNDFDGFTFVPSTAPAFDVDIEFIRFGFVDPEKLGDTDAACNGAPQPDGFIDTEDNCPEHYNPLQEDADRNGVGDACQDVDQDGTANICDNCPTRTNSRQRDRDNDGLGDACDSDPGGSCFLQPESLAGRAPGSALLPGLVGLGLSVSLFRRRRRRGEKSGA
ncbi:MAG: thrombospondin type 3 repeat-containing protein [Myxococcales bacterium]|nr:thrombospondin type 3 repeat-containing protein [Myxococcales bacterium]